MIFVLMMLIYLVIGYSTVMMMRNRTLDILRLISGVAFMMMILIYSLSLVNPAAVIVFVLGLSLMLSIEIAAFKENKNDRDNVFLIYAFTAMFAAVLIIMIFTN
ncbi:membrane stabilizing protein MspA [Salinicoccus sp. Marseille-QA3877]